MLPNVRLTVVAILATIAGISCGLGLFATFRVNHEPLARLAEGSPPLQLGLDKLGLNAVAQAPVPTRLPASDAAKVIPVPVVVATPVPDRPEAGTVISEDSASTQAAVDAAADADQGSATTVADLAPTEQASAPRDEAAPPAPQDTLAAATAQDPSASPGEPGISSSDAPRAEQIAAADPAAADQRPKAAASEPAAVSDAPVAAQMAAVDAATTDREAAAKPAKTVEKKAAKPVAKAARAAPVWRAAKVVRPRRNAVAASQPTAQYSQTTYAQPAYTQSTYAQQAYTQTYGWADGTGQTSQTVKRVVIKRHRPAKKAAPAAQSNPLRRPRF